MSIREVPPNRNGGTGDRENATEADVSDPIERARMNDGADEVKEGVEILEEVPRLNRTAEILRKRGYYDIADTLHEAGKEIARAGHDSIQHGEELIVRADEQYRAHQVADLVLSEPQQLATWQGHIKTITRAIDRWVPEDIFIEAAGGDIEAGHQRREDALHLGEWLTRLEAGAIQTAEEALRVGFGILSFIADVETILDHVPAPVKRTIWTALQALFAYFPFLR